MAPCLLAADLDGTLLGDEAGEALFRAYVSEAGPRLLLAYVTGRSRGSVQTLIESGRLPQPRFLSSAVGTELFDLQDVSNALGAAYHAQVGPGWDLQSIYALGLGAGIERQAFEHGQPPFQAGFMWDGQVESWQALQERLSPLADLYLQASYDTYIDVLPLALGKGQVVRFLQRSLGLAREQVVVAGDSGNDRQLFETGFNGIVPSNALAELKALAVQPWHYHSRYPAGRGVLDGLQHFGWLPGGPG